jgi:hypothetical protein
MSSKPKTPARAAKKPAKSRVPRPRANAKKNPAITDETRSVPGARRLQLVARAGGRCEFPGCNELLFEHRVTRHQGNFAQFAHVVAFSHAGPRGSGRRPRDIHDVENLLLLCPQCHKLVDDRPTEYPREVIVAFKTEHEARIKHVTGLAPDQRTVVVQLKARINGDAVDIPLADTVTAVAPRYPVDSQGYVIDLTAIHDEDDSLAASRNEVRRKLERLYEPGMDADKVRHLSVFALAPIPMLVYLGARLSNKIPTELYQKHRDTNDWVWKKNAPPVDYAIRVVRQGHDATKVAVLMPLSGPISLERLPPVVDDSFTTYELGLGNQPPSTDFLRTREDLVRFATKYRELLGMIVGAHPRAPEIHLFPAVPAPVAVACGHHMLPKAQPPLLVYDYIAARGDFIPRLRTDT